jgi:hypothetical protein
MPTDPLAPVYSDAGTCQFVASVTDDFLFPADYGNSVLKQLVSSLNASGWSQVSALSTNATCVLSFPFGAPTDTSTTIPFIHINCYSFAPFLNIIGVCQFIGYAPHTYIPPVNTASCVFFAYGNTVAATMASLAGAIDTLPQFTASVTPTGIGEGYTLTITAVAPGFDWDSAQVQVNGGYGLGAFFGGGYIAMRSVGGVGYEQFQIRLSTGPSIYPDNIMIIEFGAPNTSPPDWGTLTLNSQVTTSDVAVAPFSIFTGPNHFCLLDSASGAGLPSSQSIYAAAPQTSIGAKTGVFVVSPGQFKDHTYWNRGSIRIVDGVSSGLNAPYQGFPQLLQLRSPSVSLLTPDQQAVTIGPKVIFSLGSEQPGILGVIPDTLVTTQTISGFQQDGYYFHAVSSNNGSGLTTVGTLLIRIGDVHA